MSCFHSDVRQYGKKQACRLWKDRCWRANSEAKPASAKVKQTDGENRKQRAAGHLLLLLSCALLLWSVWLGDVGSGGSLVGSGPPPGVLSPSSRETSSSGRETHLRLLPSDDCTPKTELWRVLFQRRWKTSLEQMKSSTELHQSLSPR